MKSRSILIVDDEILTLTNLKKVLEKDLYEVHLADTGEKALELFAALRPSIILLDLMLPGISGIEVLRKVKEMDAETIVIMMTAYEIVEKAVEAMKLGAYDYLLKPFKINELKNVVRRGAETLSLRIRVQEHLKTQMGRYYFGKIVAESRKMKDVILMAEKIATSDKTTVLLQGESGTGKEMLAKAIHYHSPRSEKNLVDINCAAIPENLMESELFGYEAGAFTDARGRKIGLLEYADEGTVFFDEIGDLALPLQAKLLRVLEEQSFTRLGGNKPVHIDIRIIAASNKDLARASEKGEFRPDLFYRLNVVPILIPPLRSRREDIIPLALHLMADLNLDLKRSFKGFAPEAAELLQAYSWPGNVRELRNVLERVMSLHQMELITKNLLPLELREMPHMSEQDNTILDLRGNHYPSLKDMERRYIEQVLESVEGNRTRAAKILEIHPASLFRKLKSWKPE